MATPIRPTLLAIAALLAGCTTTLDAPSTEVANSSPTAQRQAPALDRDVISQRSTLAGTELSSTLTRLSGRFGTEPSSQQVAVTGDYVIGDRETQALARARLVDQLKADALRQTGTYQAVEERLEDGRELSTQLIAMSGHLVSLTITEESLTVGDSGRPVLTITAEADIEGDALRAQLDAFYDNHALREANTRLLEQNQQLTQRRLGETSTPSDRPAGASTTPADNGAPEAAASMAFDGLRRPAAIAPWTLQPELARATLSPVERVISKPRRAFQPLAGSTHNLYAPDGASAMPLDPLAKSQLDRSLQADINSLVGEYNEIIQVDIRSEPARWAPGTPQERDWGTRYTVSVTGLEGFIPELLARTQLPFAQDQLTPEQIEELDPWSAQLYWSVAEALANQPVVLEFSVEGPDGEPLATSHQLLLGTVAFSQDRSTAHHLAFSPLEAISWWLEGRHIPAMGLKSPKDHFTIDGMRHPRSTITPLNREFRGLHVKEVATRDQIRAAREPGVPGAMQSLRRPGINVESHDSARGTTIFSVVVPDDHPYIGTFTAAIQRPDRLTLQPWRTGELDMYDLRTQLSVREARAMRLAAMTLSHQPRLGGR